MATGAMCAAIMLGTLAWGPVCFVGAIAFNDALNDQAEQALISWGSMD